MNKGHCPTMVNNLLTSQNSIGTTWKAIKFSFNHNYFPSFLVAMGFFSFYKRIIFDNLNIKILKITKVRKLLHHRTRNILLEQFSFFFFLFFPNKKIHSKRRKAKRERERERERERVLRDGFFGWDWGWWRRHSGWRKRHQIQWHENL